ncbi:hypothetical protein EVAR_4184_1 [Eumeta japonica]|uniref:Uncharacterized protein n=1 Tax=Eumeta variegata TaxID=151549 RepID=A0A4C1TGU4_EUMVA|nr:hypothetical protein EVAR_4184_1 [Eumeta japonica]
MGKIKPLRRPRDSELLCEGFACKRAQRTERIHRSSVFSLLDDPEEEQLSAEDPYTSDPRPDHAFSSIQPYWWPSSC